MGRKGDVQRRRRQCIPRLAMPPMKESPYSDPRSRTNKLRTALFGLLPAAVSGFAAEPGNVDKSKYTLFNPTPREAMREFTTDRPDKTESPYTVDAGHFQIELDLITYAHDHETARGVDVRVNAWSVVPVNFKVGLLNWMDLQTVIESYN